MMAFIYNQHIDKWSTVLHHDLCQKTFILRISEKLLSHDTVIGVAFTVVFDFLQHIHKRVAVMNIKIIHPKLVPEFLLPFQAKNIRAHNQYHVGAFQFLTRKQFIQNNPRFYGFANTHFIRN